jgi:hypothetical protein
LSWAKWVKVGSMDSTSKAGEEDLDRETEDEEGGSTDIR